MSNGGMCYGTKTEGRKGEAVVELNFKSGQQGRYQLSKDGQVKKRAVYYLEGMLSIIIAEVLGRRICTTQRKKMLIIAFQVTIREMVLVQRPFWSPANHAMPVGPHTARGKGQLKRDTE